MIHTCCLESWQFAACFGTLAALSCLQTLAIGWVLLFEKGPSLWQRVGGAITILPGSAWLSWLLLKVIIAAIAR